MKPATDSSSAVPWYWGWLTLCGATAAGQSLFGETDWARLSPSSNAPTLALNAPVQPCHLQFLILSHNLMSAGEMGGERLGQTERFTVWSPHGTGSVLQRLETRQRDRTQWHTHMTQENYSFLKKPTDWVTERGDRSPICYKMTTKRNVLQKAGNNGILLMGNMNINNNTVPF